MAEANFSESLSFENGTGGWNGGLSTTGSRSFGTHSVSPVDGSSMGFLSPTGGNNWSSAQRDLLLSGNDVSEAILGNITNVDYTYLDITLRQGQTSEVNGTLQHRLCSI